MAGWYRDLMPGALPKLHKGRSVSKELLTGMRQGRSGFVSHEQRSSKLILKSAYACAHRRLGDIKPFCSPNKTSGRNDLNKGSGEFGVHRTVCSRKHASNRQ